MRWIIVVSLLLAGLSARARTWTSVSGQTVEAEYEGSQGALVILRTENNQKVMIPLAQLSAEDQQFVREQQAAKAPAPPALPTRPSREPHHAAGKPVAVPSTTPAILTGPGGRKEGKTGKGELLTDEEIAALQKELVVDEKTGEKLEFVGGIVAKQRLGDKDPDWKEGMPIAIHVTCELVRAKPKKDGVMERKPLNGTAEFYVTDESGAVIVRKSEPLDKMAPTGSTGFRGEVPKIGKYKLVIYTDYKGTRFGLTETINVRAPARH